MRRRSEAARGGGRVKAAVCGALGAACAALTCACDATIATAGPCAARGAAAGERPNVVVFLTDDQRLDSVPGVAPEYMPQDLMPTVRDALIARGVNFTQAVVENPRCCPSRASFLSGGFFSHNTGVLTNTWPNGGARRFDDRRTLATLLKRKGYTTVLIGKYLNGYNQLGGADAEGKAIPPKHYVPPGWDVFICVTSSGDWRNYEIVVGAGEKRSATRGVLLPSEAADLPAFLEEATARGFPPSVASYLLSLDPANLPHVTDFERAAAVRTAKDLMRAGDAPFFLNVCLEVPHGPATPPAQDRDLLPGFEFRARAWGEDNVRDKPRDVREAAELFADYYAGRLHLTSDDRLPDAFFADQLRCLPSADRTMADVLEALENREDWRERTMYVYASDNGLLWGEHRLFDKGKPYEECVRVPLVIRGPGVVPASASAPVYANIDLAPTILEWAGYAPSRIVSDGVSLVPLLTDPEAARREEVLLQVYYRGAHEDIREPGCAAVRGERWKYIEHDTGELELYDLAGDPFEARSRHADEGEEYADARARGAGVIAAQRGLTALTDRRRDGSLKSGTVGLPYELVLPATGGTPPYHWSLDAESEFPPPTDCEAVLPPGLELQNDGRLAGIPQREGCYEFVVRVEDESASPQHGGPQRHVRSYRIYVAAE
ncbi:MAG: hypothetical protein FLDDKLPJ_00300 [Phycisphaerae bacterium]|nr:hypothetical protein [Phycisphaerae bacterium]